MRDLCDGELGETDEGSQLEFEEDFQVGRDQKLPDGNQQVQVSRGQDQKENQKSLFVCFNCYCITITIDLPFI